MPKIICTECQTSFRPYKIGVYCVDMAFSPPSPYEIRVADAYICPGCAKIVIVGFANEPISRHFDSDFQEVLIGLQEKEKRGETLIFYNYEKPTVSQERAAYLRNKTKSLEDDISESVFGKVVRGFGGELHGVDEDFNKEGVSNDKID